MSLRVLLADESDSIKKVFQLSLQDYSPEIKTVHSGLDVLDVASHFKPDIIFADVLLQKKNGYDVCLEIKQSPNLQNTPVVLMWSSFMELDQPQFTQSQADEKLEKPFDADNLRKIIQQLVAPAENPISQFLNFPKKQSAPLKEVPIKEESSEFNQKGFTIPSSPPPIRSSPPPRSTPGMDLPTFTSSPMGQEISLPSMDTSPARDSWQSKDLSKFKLSKEADADSIEKFETLNLNESKKTSLPPPMDLDEITSKIDLQNLDLTFNDSSTTPPPAREAFTGLSLSEPDITPMDRPLQKSAGVSVSSISEAEIEGIVRAHTEEILKIKMQPLILDIIERVVREELNKLLDDEVRLNKDAGR